MKNDVKNSPLPVPPLMYRLARAVAKSLGLKVFKQTEKTPIKFRGQALMPPTLCDKEFLAAAAKKRAVRASKNAVILQRSAKA